MDKEKRVREEQVRKILAIDKAVWEKYIPENERNTDWKYPENQKDNPYYAGMVLGADMEAVFERCDITVEEMKETINQLADDETLALLDSNPYNIEHCKDAADIRKDWAQALRSVKRGTELSYRIDFGFSEVDISELAKLHKKNKFRRKIEDLLTDCNFHTECSDFDDGLYDKYIIVA